MEATAVSVGKAVLDGALGYAKSKAAEEIALQLGVERDVTFITDELQMMQSFLMTADEERGENKVLTTWVKQVRDLAYNVEDNLMDFGIHSEKKPFWGCIPRDLCDRRRIAKEVKDLRAKVEDVSNRNLRYRLIKDGSSSKHAIAAAAEQASIASAAMFGINEARLSAVEREKSKVNLHQLINNEDKDLRVIAVWGSNGDLGKLSVIREVYDDPTVNLNFGLRAWVRLVRPFNPKEFVHSLVRQLYEKFPKKLGEEQERRTVGANVMMKVDNMGQSDIVDMFDAQVSENRYLIVINDLTTIEEWDCIKQYFPDKKKRSRIIVSTQQVEIASLCTEQPYQVSELKQLSSDQTLYLFHNKEVTRIAKETNDQRSKVEDVNNRNLRYRLIKDGSSSKHAAVAEQASIATPAMFGINEARLAVVQQEKSKVDLLELISSEEENLGVIAVWGTSGDLGKTYEIRAAYDSPQVLTKFGCRAWVRLMHPFEPKEFLKSLVRQFYENSPKKLRETQKGKTVGIDVLMKMETMGQSDIALVFDTLVSDNSYLIVIDDLSTIVEWDCIKKFLPNNKNRSRIIVSAKQAEIASLCPGKPLQVTELKELSPDQTIFLFHKEVMPSSNSSVPLSSSITTTTTEHSSAMSNGEIEDEDQRRSGDKVTNSAAGKKFDRCRTMALVDEVFTGRENAMSDILRLVGEPNDNQGHKVISVWGMGGLGKTTLVRSVYRSQSLGAWKRAWVTSLRPFNHKVLIRSLASQLLKDVQEDPTEATATKTQKKNIATMGFQELAMGFQELAMGFQELVDELTRLLNTHKCLIVLDDISTTEEWDLVRSCLRNVGRIIVTTRGKNIAKHCSIEYNNMYSLERLENDAALDLFKKKVFKDKTENIDLLPDIMEQARLILKKCDGLALAISTIGGFLATKPRTATEWRKINGRISAELEINPELRTIKTVLMRSYDGLPYHLKSCFLYMSIFPEDHKIRQKRLVERWIAEGYAREMHGMTAKEVGDKYFDELLDRSMIIPGEGVNHYNGKIDSCQLHDIIREICISKAREENLVFTLEDGCCLSSAQGAIRHLVVSSGWKRDKDVFEGMLDLSHVRSLTVFGEWRSYFISDKMRFLRILDLEDTLGLRDHHLDQIGQLLHLKYLSLRGCRNILQLPNSFGNLRHLQTLDIRGTRIIELPTTITKLRKLEHVRASDDLVRRQDGGTEDDILLGALEYHMRKLGQSDFPSRCCCALSFMCAIFSYVAIEDRPEEAYEEAGLQDTTVRKKHGWISSRLPHIFRSLLFQSRMRLFSASLFLSMGHLFWRPQIIEDGLNMHNIFRIYRTAKVYMVETEDVTGTLGRVEIPRGFGKLKSLHTLDIVNVALDKGKAALKELGKLTQLRKLGVAGINSTNSEKFWSPIADNNQLRSLSVCGSVLDGCLGKDLLFESLRQDDCLGKDLLPPKHLESLKLEGKLVKVTEWIHQLQNLSKLQLKKTELEQDVIQVLGKLPNLAALHLRQRSFVGEKLHFQGSSFPSLMVLELYALHELISVFIEKQAMPKLELLQANWCREVEEISGLAFITSLKEIRLGDGNKYKMNEEVKSQVAEHLKHVSLKLM